MAQAEFVFLFALQEFSHRRRELLVDEDTRELHYELISQLENYFLRTDHRYGLSMYTHTN
eukprot:CAMPEP_0204891114 /NCGR_PEP_ID=MMETSP1349-20130617/26470_1 /ASSEMBLY_ACC=CAM_ASM_000710 /TAXON_ID=215587 /ORGANISM="Aplanochytrium stocchinoi, Strain GSBS06" /LENGTH=59 /DNA_ID=CAMNT_0052056249 /DNA_START=302 /DNA_END=478 /DNA_ORIENTATION=+